MMEFALAGELSTEAREYYKNRKYVLAIGNASLSRAFSAGWL